MNATTGAHPADTLEHHLDQAVGRMLWFGGAFAPMTLGVPASRSRSAAAVPDADPSPGATSPG